MTTVRFGSPFLAAALFLASCGGGIGERTTTPEPAGPALTRQRFNQLAMRLDLPIFWEADADGDGEPDPGEVRALLFYPTEGRWTVDGRFTPEAEQAIARIRQEASAPPPADPRQRLVVAEIDHAQPTLVRSDFRQLPEAHRSFARHMLRVADRIDGLYAVQTGMKALEGRVASDVASRAVFRRNWGPRCSSAITEHEPACSAIEGASHQPVDVYPAALQSQEGFCQQLEARPDATTLLSPFTVVRERDGNLVAVPYTEAYAEPMRAIARELRAAADAIAADPAEAALVTYLRAAAGSFESNDWGPADEAWSRMNARNSTWYVRVGPDETYWEPCSMKAGFHLTLARINRDSLAWQDRLAPLQQDMERSVAELAPDVYRPRDVTFHLPDFIDIVVNAGDDRDAFGATIGQSLPNWGLVAEQSRGRTVAMSNLYTDPDSAAMRRAQASTVVDAAMLAELPGDPEPGLLSTIFHEAMHNLGPSHEYRHQGRTADEAFGGGLASMLEELKAQTGALHLIDWLREKGVLTEAQARRTYVDSIVWAFGHVSRGMYRQGGAPKAYGQLAAIQVGFLMDAGALRWDPQAIAADGEHRGAFAIDFVRMPQACRALMEKIVRIKATNDRAAAEALKTRYVDGDVVPEETIAERYREFPQNAFVYSVEL